MNLDETQDYNKIDKQDMLSYINQLPDQIETAWKSGFEYELPTWHDIRNVIISGMGGSAIGGDLASSYALSFSKVPIFVSRDYGLPVWAHGPSTLLIASSHSGETEETLQAYNDGVEAGCQCLALTTGGNLAQTAIQAGKPLWKFQHHGQPRTAVGFSFAFVLAALVRLNLVPDVSEELLTAIRAMRIQQERIHAGRPAVENQAKQIASQLIARWVTVFGAGVMAPVARRWKCQINELAKAWAQFETLPEADHNTLAGIQVPEHLHKNLTALFLQNSTEYIRNRLRIQLTSQVFAEQGIQSEIIEFHEHESLANLWIALHLGDYVAYYLALSYGIDPTPVDALNTLKHAIKTAG